MKVYIDLVIFLNFFLDFILLLSVSIILRRNIKFYKFILGALVGLISVIFLYININSFCLFISKIIISIFMILITFGFKDFKYTFNNLIYLYIVSIFLGGGLYLLDNSFKINVLLVIITSPLLIIFYINKVKKLKNEYSKMYEVEITFLNGKIKRLTAFLDTGNNLYDPYKKRPIIVINKSVLEGYNPRTLLVPIKTVNKESMMKCFKIKKLVVNKKIIEDDVLVGISDNNFGIEGVDLLLHQKIIKER